jgi:hypothetical protein
MEFFQWPDASSFRQIEAKDITLDKGDTFVIIGHVICDQHEGIVASTLWTNSISLLRIMPSLLEFPVVSGQHTISKYRSLVHMSSYIGTFFMWNQISSWFHFHLTWKTVSISLCNLPGSFVLSDGTYRYWTGKYVTCPVGSTLSWSAEFKYRNTSAHAVHIWGDW